MLDNLLSEDNDDDNVGENKEASDPKTVESKTSDSDLRPYVGDETSAAVTTDATDSSSIWTSSLQVR